MNKEFEKSNKTYLNYCNQNGDFNISHELDIVLNLIENLRKNSNNFEIMAQIENKIKLIKEHV